MSLPPAFEERMKARLKDEYEAFFSALQSTPPVSIRQNPQKTQLLPAEYWGSTLVQEVPWCSHAVYLSNRPVFTLDPCFHGGAYYVQEASSMFLDHILREVMPSGPVRILDLCAAPGGKSTLIASRLPKDSLLVANETIRSRAAILRENIIKWGNANVVVTNNDPADFSNLPAGFDMILVDAPCSGEGMFRKDAGAIEEWSEDNLRLCSERQKRILSDIWDNLKPGGFLIYSTCTYNRGENEAILEWIMREFDARSISIEHSFNTITPGDSEIASYRFYPHKTTGEGFFVGVIQKQSGVEKTPGKKRSKMKHAPLPEEISRLLQEPDKMTAYTREEATGFIPTVQAPFISLLDETLRVIYKGCEAVELNNRKIKLLPPLALYDGLNISQCTLYPADRTTALTYLKKEDIPALAKAGEWVLVTHRDMALGWCKSLGNRLNNYYPKEWRIRMALPASGEQ